MFPSFTTGYSPRQIRRNFVLSANRFNYCFILCRALSCFVTKRKSTSNVQRLLFGKKRLRVALSTECSTSFHHIPAIIGVCSWAGMGRINARWVIATVKQSFSFWYSFFVNQFPRDTVRSQSAFVVRSPDNSVSILLRCSSPEPALSERWLSRMYWPIFIDLIPKSFLYWNLDELAFAVYLHAMDFTLHGLQSKEVRA